MYNNKKGQMGETITWVVATIIVVVILGISISILSFNTDSRKMIIPITSDIFAVKSLVSYLSTNNIYNELSAEGVEDFTSESGTLASNIFYGIYNEKVSGVWVGFFIEELIPQKKNDFFPKISNIRGGDVSFKSRYAAEISEKIILGENKFIEVYLIS